MQSTSSFAVCVKNEGYAASLELRKVYEVLRDTEAATLGRLRVVDESGEDYLYPQDFFVHIEVSAELAARIARAA